MAYRAKEIPASGKPTPIQIQKEKGGDLMFDINEASTVCEAAKNTKLFTANKYITSNGVDFIRKALKGWPETIFEAEKLKVENELLKKQCETCGDNDGYISCLKDAQRENTFLREEINTINQRMADVTKENYLLKEELKAAKQIELPR